MRFGSQKYQPARNELRSLYAACVHHDCIGALLSCAYLWAQVLTGGMKLAWLASLVAFTIMIILKSIDGQRYFVLNPAWHIAQLVLGIAMLAGLDFVLLRWLYRLSVSLHLRMWWSERRKRPVRVIGLRAALMNLNLISDILVNALVLAHPGHFCKVPMAITALNGVRWLGWNTILVLLIEEVHMVHRAMACMAQEGEMDAPEPAPWLSTGRGRAAVYGPKAFWWLANTGALLGLLSPHAEWPLAHHTADDQAGICAGTVRQC